MWVSWPHLSLCADAHGLVCCGCAESSSTRRSSGRRRSSSCWPISSGASPGSRRSLPTNSLVRDGVLPSAIDMPTLAQFRFSGLAISSAEIQIKYAEAILSNSTRKLLRFEIIRMLVAFKKINLFASFIIQLYVYSIFRVPRGLNCPSLNDESERERTIVFAKSFLFIYLFVYFAGVADLPGRRRLRSSSSVSFHFAPAITSSSHSH